MAVPKGTMAASLLTAPTAGKKIGSREDGLSGDRILVRILAFVTSFCVSPVDELFIFIFLLIFHGGIIPRVDSAASSAIMNYRSGRLSEGLQPLKNRAGPLILKSDMLSVS